MQVPRLDKIVINMGVGDATHLTARPMRTPQKQTWP
jgi:ribosomal protein L5